MEITTYITECIQNKTPVSFSKYGDGEIYCIFYKNGSNCDGDNYSDKLSDALRKSYIYMTEQANNAYIGMWPNPEKLLMLENLSKKKLNFASYHTILFIKTGDENKSILYKTIKHSKMKKIIVCNELLIKSKLLLNIDEIIIVPFNNWFDTHFDNILQEVKEKIENDGNHIVITCCGMSAKVLICELYKSFPNGIYLDFGSALDMICTKRDSRGWNYGYDYYANLLKDCLPEDFEDDKYTNIYSLAKIHLGIHLSN